MRTPSPKPQRQTRPRQKKRTGAGGGTKRGRTTPQAEIPSREFDIGCNAIIAWSEQIEKDYPDTFRLREYYIMSDLFTDQHFKPLFGKSFADMDEPERQALWKNTIKPCFKVTREKPYNWQNQELWRAFKDESIQYSYPEALRYATLKQEDRDWIANAFEKLRGPSMDNNNKEARALVDEIRLRYIWLAPVEKKTIKTKIETLGFGLPNWDVDPKTTHIGFPDLERDPVNRDTMLPTGRTVGDLAGEISRCDVSRASKVKSEYLSAMNRIYPEKVNEAEEYFNEQYVKSIVEKARLGVTLVSDNPQRLLESEGGELRCKDLLEKSEKGLTANVDMFMNGVASDQAGRPLGPRGEIPGWPLGFARVRFDQDDPEEEVIITADGKVLSEREIKWFGQNLVSAMAYSKKCDIQPAQDYQGLVLKELERLYGTVPEYVHRLKPQEGPTRRGRECEQVQMEVFEEVLDKAITVLTGSPRFQKKRSAS